FLAMAGEPDVVEKLKKGGYKANGKTFKNHIDGFNLLPFLTGKEAKSPRDVFFYFSDDGDMMGVRWNNWKISFMEQRCRGTLDIWGEPFVKMRLPKIYNMRTDPYERSDITSNTYHEWHLRHAFIVYPVLAGVSKFVETFREFPSVQHPDS